MEINYWAVLAAAVATFLASGVYYTLMGPRLAALNPTWGQPQPAWKTIQEPFRSLITALVVAGLSGLIGIESIGGALLLALALWVAFPIILLAGSVIHENVPTKLALVHAGDWLLKLIIISVLVALWR